MTNHNDPRTVLIVSHGGRADLPETVSAAVGALSAGGIEVVMAPAEAARFPDLDIRSVDRETVPAHTELVLVFGGDGTILRAAQLAHAASVPLLGVNLGHMGFLAESERDAIPAVVAAVIDRKYSVEERMALEVLIRRPDGTVARDWAVNEVSLEKADRERMVEYVLAVDDVPLSTLAADGIVCATPTGSTAYAWSAGGPVVWPQVEALVVVPISAHALFGRPLVVSPDCEIELEVLEVGSSAVAWCDGSRRFDVPPGSRIEVKRSNGRMKFARLHEADFTSRLVRKFDLPVRGWRGKTRFTDIEDASD